MVQNEEIRRMQRLNTRSAKFLTLIRKLHVAKYGKLVEDRRKSDKGVKDVGN